MKGTRKIDLSAAIIFILLAVIMIWVAIPLGVQEPKKVKFVALSPSYYPLLVSYCLLAFGLLIALTQYRKVEKNAEKNTEKKAEDDDIKPRLEQQQWMTLLGIVITLFLYFWFLDAMGFVLNSTIALFILMLLAGERSIIWIFVIALTVPIALYTFFTHVANIPIPAGVLAPYLIG